MLARRRSPISPRRILTMNAEREFLWPAMRSTCANKPSETVIEILRLMKSRALEARREIRQRHECGVHFHHQLAVLFGLVAHALPLGIILESFPVSCSRL